MFPLGLVHFPGVPLPLQVFEPRYQQLTADCLDGNREFGVVLIERGSEVGGGDARFDIGTITTIVNARFNDLGLIHLDTLGVRRVRIARWLEDDPYPRAEVEDLPPPLMGDEEMAAMVNVERKVRRALAWHAELVEPAAPHNIAVDGDPTVAIFQLAAIAPLGPVDHQRLLAAVQPAELLAHLDHFMTEHLDVLASRLAGH